MTNQSPTPESGRQTAPGTPRWVKVFVIIAIVLVLAFVVLQIASGGEHGPGRHTPFRNTGDGETITGDFSSSEPLISTTEQALYPL